MDTLEEFYSHAMDLFFGWHVLLANFAEEIKSCISRDVVEKAIIGLQTKQAQELKKFKNKVEKTLGVKLPDNNLPGELGEFYESSLGSEFEIDGLKGGEDLKMALKTAGTHIYVWKKDIDSAIHSTQTDEDHKVGNLKEFKSIISTLPEVHEDMIGKVRGDMYSICFPKDE